MLELKEKECFVHIHEDMTLVYSGSVFVGDQDITYVLLKRIDVSLSVIETHKRGIFLPPESDLLQNDVDLFDHIKPVYGGLIKGVYDIVDKYLSVSKQMRIQKIILTGLFHKYTNIELSISKNLSIPTKLLEYNIESLYRY